MAFQSLTTSYSRNVLCTELDIYIFIVFSRDRHRLHRQIHDIQLPIHIFVGIIWPMIDITYHYLLRTLYRAHLCTIRSIFYGPVNNIMSWKLLLKYSIWLYSLSILDEHLSDGGYSRDVSSTLVGCLHFYYIWWQCLLNDQD